MIETKISCSESSRTLIAQEIGSDISEENADNLVKQFENNPYISVSILRDGWLSKHRGRDVKVIYVYVKYPHVTIESQKDGETPFKLKYELKW